MQKMLEFSSVMLHALSPYIQILLQLYNLMASCFIASNIYCTPRKPTLSQAEVTINHITTELDNHTLLQEQSYNTHTHTHTCLTALCPGLPGWAGTRKVKPIQILVKQETVSGNGISWAICKSTPHSRQITTPAPHHSVFYRPDALPAAQPTASKHWRHRGTSNNK